MKKLENVNNTARCYPRSLAEAYPDKRAPSGDWVRYSHNRVSGMGHRLVFAVALTGVIAFVVLACFGGLK
jgi:hypothetical protein